MTSKQKTIVGEFEQILHQFKEAKDLYNPELHSKRLEWAEKTCKDYSLDTKYSEELAKAMNSLLKIIKLI